MLLHCYYLNYLLFGSVVFRCELLNVTNPKCLINYPSLKVPKPKGIYFKYTKSLKSLHTKIIPPTSQHLPPIRQTNHPQINQHHHQHYDLHIKSLAFQWRINYNYFFLISFIKSFFAAFFNLFIKTPRIFGVFQAEYMRPQILR